MPSSILVVDDEKFIVEAISQLLRESGHDVVGLVDSTEAVEVLKKRSFDLVLTDLRMPNVTGMDITRIVRGSANDTLVIILTGFATLDSAIESVSLDVYAYLNKPFDLRELGHVVDRALTAQSLKRENDRLHASIRKMLDDVSTLYEVTRFLYDTDDWDITLEFILDTLAIGLGLTHSCLLLVDAEGRTTVGKANYPPESTLAEVVASHEWDAVMEAIPANEPTLVDGDHAAANLLAALTADEQPLKAILFTPIRYRERLMGYLVVFVVEGSEPPTDDQRQLLKILAVQISPQVFQSGGSVLRGQSAPHWAAQGQSIIESQIEALSDSNSMPLGVNLLRFHTPNPGATARELTAFQDACADMLLNHEPASSLHWIGADTALAFFPGSNQVQSEITCLAMSEDFRKSVSSQIQNASGAELFYASATWPDWPEDSADFLTMLWARLSSQIQDFARQQLADTTKDD
ncbi:MAG: response regulator [Candidatus Marinimicrobia bacterium]|nr:response regulator [Candidatus Neomarinimicrobiota bacterium]